MRLFGLVSKPFALRSLRCVGAIAFLLVGPAQDAVASVVTFDWPASPGWTAGAPTPGQTNTQVFTSFYPNDITVSINNSGAAAQGMVWSAGYPQISSTPVSAGAAVPGLQLFVTSSQVTGAYAQITIAFATPVTNLSFQLWDVDRQGGTYADRISNIQGLTDIGGTVGADSVTSAMPGYNTITGSGLTTVVTGTNQASNTTNQGTINISFLGPVTQFSFQWSNADPALGPQGIAVGSLIYTPVPENSAALAVALCVAAAVAESRRRRRGRLVRLLPVDG